MFIHDASFPIFLHKSSGIWKTSSMCQARPSPWRSARSPASASTATSRRSPQWAPWGPGRLATSCACDRNWTRWSLRKGEERWGKLESSCWTVLVVSNLEFQAFFDIFDMKLHETCCFPTSKRLFPHISILSTASTGVFSVGVCAAQRHRKTARRWCHLRKSQSGGRYFGCSHISSNLFHHISSKLVTLDVIYHK